MPTYRVPVSGILNGTVSHTFIVEATTPQEAQQHALELADHYRWRLGDVLDPDGNVDDLEAEEPTITKEN